MYHHMEDVLGLRWIESWIRPHYSFSNHDYWKHCPLGDQVVPERLQLFLVDLLGLLLGQELTRQIRILLALQVGFLDGDKWIAYPLEYRPMSLQFVLFLFWLIFVVWWRIDLGIVDIRGEVWRLGSKLWSNGLWELLSSLPGSSFSTNERLHSVPYLLHFLAVVDVNVFPLLFLNIIALNISDSTTDVWFPLHLQVNNVITFILLSQMFFLVTRDQAELSHRRLHR